MSGPKVLLVDDEQDFVEALAERMQVRGYTVETAGDGEQAIAKAAEGEFDAVFLDLAMPGLDGIETLKRLKEIDPELQVILLTGQATVRKGIEAMKLGALDLLEKPADIKQLLAKIEEATNNKAVLAEERVMEELDEIVRKRGW
jgi:DNA-binding NtrC family response regulator